MKPSIIRNIFEAYLHEPLSSEEKAIIEKWEDENTNLIRGLLPEGRTPLAEIELKMREKIRHSIGYPIFTKRYVATFIGKAAVIFIVVSFLLFTFVKVRSQKYQLVESPRGKKVFLTLPDGSQVWLNAGSEIKYSKDFFVREVSLLKGEAYFDVKHIEKRPFYVRHEGVYVKVLGTAFNVRAYNSNETRVTVNRGRVEVGEKHIKYAVLTPNEEIIFTKNIPSFIAVREVDAQKISAWKSDQIHLYNISFEDIVLSIENNYGVKIHYPSEMNKGIYVLHYSTNTDITHVLSMLEMI